MTLYVFQQVFRNGSGIRRELASLGLLCFLLTAPAQGQETPDDLYFPQFVTGGGYFSQITILNPNSGSAQPVTLRLADEIGNPLSNVEFTLNSGSGAVQVHTDESGEVVLSIQPNGSLLLETESTGDQVLGSAVVTAPIEIDGVIVFGGDFGLAGVQSSDEFSHGFMGPVESVGSEVRTAVAIQNLENSSVSLTLELLSRGGEREALSNPVNIPARGRVARFVDELFADSGVDFSEFGGAVRLVSEEDVAAMMLQTRPDQLATLPVTELPQANP